MKVNVRGGRVLYSVRQTEEKMGETMEDLGGTKKYAAGKGRGELSNSKLFLQDKSDTI